MPLGVHHPFPRLDDLDLDEVFPVRWLSERVAEDIGRTPTGIELARFAYLPESYAADRAELLAEMLRRAAKRLTDEQTEPAVVASLANRVFAALHAFYGHADNREKTSNLCLVDLLFDVATIDAPATERAELFCEAIGLDLRPDRIMARLRSGFDGWTSLPGNRAKSSSKWRFAAEILEMIDGVHRAPAGLKADWYRWRRRLRNSSGTNYR